MKLIPIIMIIFLAGAQPVPSIAAEEAIPDAILKRADGYIIKKVGESYFRQNYRFDPVRSRADRHPDHVEYFLYYEYAPLARMGAETSGVFVRMLDRTDYLPYDYVACVNAGKVCEPRITREQALDIVAGKGIEQFSRQTAAIRLGIPGAINSYRTWTWLINIPMGSDGGCRTFTEVWIDTVTGTYSERGSTVCE
jgi:hypothetical protein